MTTKRRGPGPTKTPVPMKQLENFAARPEGVPAVIAAYVRGILNLHESLDRYRTLFADLDTFVPLLAYLEDIEYTLDEGILWILAFSDGKLKFDDLSEKLKDHTAQDLEGALDRTPTLIPDGEWNAENIAERFVSDVESLTSRLHDEIKAKGYHLYHVLIGASFA